MVEHDLAKVGVASSSLVFRSKRLKIKQLSLPKTSFGRLFCCEKPAPTPLEARLCSANRKRKKQKSALPCRLFVSRFLFEKKCSQITRNCLTIKRIRRMKNTFSMTFYCRKSAVRKSSKLAPIELVILLNGERWLFALPRKSTPEEFKREMRSKMQTPTKDYTSAVATKIQGFQTKCLLEGKPFTKESIKEFIHFGFTDDHYTMGFLFDGFLKSQKKKVDGGLSTYRNYRKCQSRIHSPWRSS